MELLSQREISERLNNAFKNSYPVYANEASNAGVQPYGDWRGRTFSLSLKAEF